MNQELIIKYLADQINEKQKQQMLQWIEESRENAKYFAEIKNIWVASSVNYPVDNLNLEKEFEIISYRLDKMKQSGKKLIYKLQYLSRIAAILLLAYGIGFTWYHLSEKNNISYNEISTQRGEKSLVKLSDGTNIWLNSETSLRYPTNLNSKKVEVILDGEAYFDVAKIANRTFIVKASSLNITVLGTSFNVKSYNQENIIETTLEKGRISITGQVGKIKIQKPVVLLPNQQARFINDSSNISIINAGEKMASKSIEENKLSKEKTIPAKKPKLIVKEKVDSKDYTSWKDGKLIFKGERLEDLALRLERWHDAKISINSLLLKDKTYTGIFEKETIEQALHALSMSYPFKYNIDKNIITITEY